MLEGLVSKDHFDGGRNVQKGDGLPADLALIVRAVQKDLVSVLGIKGVQTISIADPAVVANVDATDLPTLLALVNEEKASYNGIAYLANDVASRLGPVQEVDITSPNASVESLADAIDEATAIALANDIKAKYSASVALLNEIKADLNTEATVTIAAADAVVEATADATDLATALTLVNALKIKVNVAITLITEIKTDLNAAAKIVLESLALLS